ncbi:hypothetical protein GCM10023317_06680 [Actinopolymorpha pittospori]|uniref:DDE superfamily endonuclease n=1 Tax=Actinopolymorpha pittospori TaxID=648752 RepID=A0A927RI15_9ACTN|nr:hypothetical protein [Actinopolymorpha pittospori]
MPERPSHNYVRNGITSLFAAFNTADGTVISALHRRHRAAEFKKFLAKIDATVPADPCAVSGDGLEDLVCRFRPDVGPLVVVPAFDPVADVGVEFAEGSVCTAA